MFVKYAAAVAAVFSAPVLASASSPQTPLTTEGAQQKIVTGAWTGKLLQKDWTIEFRNEDGNLRGRMMVSGGGNWQPLHELTISGRSVSFALQSKPKMSFALDVGPTYQDMSGSVTLDGLATIPFSATRTP